ncbi:MAG: methyltransferase domain-containing protein [Candidatus Buchananbacteria bacterium]
MGKLKTILKKAKRNAKMIFYVGNGVECPCCGKKFKKFIDISATRKNAICPNCDSYERHRLLWLFLKNKTTVFSKPQKMLHIAPEPMFQKKFKTMKHLDYISADLDSPLAMVKMDITDIKYPNNTFDMIICNHVLEHIVDEQKALSEIKRVLKPNGQAILQVPVHSDYLQTYEDNSIISEEGRLKAFGQKDHVRIYGLDYADRFKKSDMDIKIIKYCNEFNEADIAKYGLRRDEEIPIATKI